MSAQLSVPTVTQADLDSFHTRHFASSIPPVSLTTFSASNEQDAAGWVEDVDDLGYYPDGQKRTLTDQQIEMFRFSEVQTLLRARRQQREREQEQLEAAEEVVEQDGPPEADSQDDREDGEASTGEEHEDDDDDDEAEYMRFLERERQQLLRQESAKRGEGMRGKGAASKTERRMARELDERAVEDEPVLDYGDESVEAPKSSSTFTGRKRVSYDDDEAVDHSTAKKRTFLWPAIG